MLWIYLAIIGFICLVIIFFVFYKARVKKLTKFNIKKIKTRLIEIDGIKPEEQIIQLDKLLDYALQQLGKQGSLGEKLKNSERHFRDINSVWKAHKVRNLIAHDFEYKLSPDDFKMAKRNFINGLRDLGL